MFFWFSFLFSQQQLADGVLALVGGRSVLYSSVLEEAYFKAQFLKINPSENPEKFKGVFENILKDKVKSLLILNAAEKDSTLSVSNDEVDKSLNERINYYIKELGSVDALEEQFGMNRGQIKNKYWGEIKDELLINAFRYKMFSDVGVSRNEVVSFFENNQDSIPDSPSRASFSLIHKKVSFSDNSLLDFEKSLGALVDSLRGGLLVFDEVVLQRSLSDSHEPVTSSRGEMLVDYERAAFSLSVGEISLPVKTDVGYFIVLLVSRFGEKITTKHVLLKNSFTERDYKQVKTSLDSLVVFCKNDPGLFDSLAVVGRTGRENFSGYFNDMELSFFPLEVVEKIEVVPENSFSEVFLVDDSFFVFYKYSFVGQNKSSLEKNWSSIESLAVENKRRLLFDMWIEKEFNNVYVKINSIY